MQYNTNILSTTRNSFKKQIVSIEINVMSFFFLVNQIENENQKQNEQSETKNMLNQLLLSLNNYIQIYFIFIDLISIM